MNLIKKTTLLLGAAAILGGAAAATAPQLTGQVRAAGSSTVGPITEHVAQLFAKEHPELLIQNQVVGTGGGFKRFTAGETDISNASRVVKWSEVEKAKANGIEFVELPVAYDGITVCTNPSNTWCKSLTVDQLKAIFSEGSKIELWSDLDPKWPSEPVKLFFPGTDSGTFDYFHEEIVGKDTPMRSEGVQVSESDNILVGAIASEPGALGFFGCAYYFANKDRVSSIAIDGGDGPVKPTSETIADGTYTPLSRPLFIYVNTKSAQRREVRAFVEFYLEKAAEVAQEVGYVELPRKISFLAKRKFASMETGSHFYDENGKAKSGGLEEIYK